MGVRDQDYKLDKVVELDEGFFESVDTEKNTEEKGVKLKRGRGGQRQTTAMVMASTIHSVAKPGKHKTPTKFRYVKMIVVNNLKAKTIEQKVDGNIDFNSIVRIDNYSSYSNLKDHVWVHQAQVITPKEAGKVLPWVHIMITNAKRTLIGVHHMISKKYFQDYVDEFCYNVNRRYFGESLFDRLLIACVSINYKNFVNVTR